MEQEGKSLEKRRTTAAERAGILEQYWQSGLSRKEFARKHQITLYTLHRWISRARKETEAESFPFREVPLLSPFASATWAVEILSRSGITIRLRDRVSAEELSRILRGIGC